MGCTLSHSIRCAALLVTAGVVSHDSPAAQCLREKLASSFPPTFWFEATTFGSRVALDGTRMAIASGYGIEMLDLSGGAWVPAGVLGEPGAKSGASLALDGDVLVVGVPDAQNPGLPPGAALVYERSGGVWSLATTLHAGDAQYAGGFGRAVDVSGTRVLIGSTSGAASQSGAAWIFERGGAGWAQTAKLAPPAPDIGFASAVALDGDRALVSAPFAPSGAAKGGALVYEYSGAQWLPSGLLLPPSPLVAQQLGASCALAGARAVLSSSGVAGAEVYELQSGAWSHTATLALPAGIGGGTVVDSSGQHVLVGSTQRRTFLYSNGSAGWSAPHELPLIDHPSPLLIPPGGAIAIDGDDAIVGIPNIVLPGSAYAFSISGSGCPPLLGEPGSIDVSIANAAQSWQIEAGAAQAGRVYLVLGSLSGTAPGVLLDGHVLPLVPDAYTTYTLTAPNQVPLFGTLGVLDANGSATARFQLFDSHPLFGITAHHAYVVLDLAAGVVAMTSNAVAVSFD